MKRKVIIDCDTGVDDAQSILMALAQPNIDVVAITCVTGNVSSVDAARNTMRVLHAAQCTDIPVYIGSKSPLHSPHGAEMKYESALKYHGSDGLGDVPGWMADAPYDKINTVEKAAVAICRLVKTYSHEIELIALGPLTNVALAFKLDDEVPAMLKSLHIMGGAIHAKGNVTVTGEYNFHIDPEAAAIVIAESVCHTLLVSWETVCSNGLPWSWFETWTSHNSEVMKFIKAFTKHTVTMDKDTWKVPYCPPDVVAMAIALRPEMMLKHDLCHCVVDTSQNPMTRGMLIVDWRHTLKIKPNITVCLTWDDEVFRNVLESIPCGFQQGA